MKNHYKSALRITTWQAEGRNRGKTTTFAEKKNLVSPSNARSYLNGCHGEYPRTTVWTAWPSASLSRSSSKRFIFVPSSKNCPRRADIFVKWGGNHHHEQLFCREKRRVLFGRVREMGASLGEVCRLCRKIILRKKLKSFTPPKVVISNQFLFHISNFHTIWTSLPTRHHYCA